MLNLSLGMFFSLVGMAAFCWAKKAEEPRAFVLAIALMLFPYFSANPIWTGTIGVVLTTLLFYPKYY